MTNQNPLHKLRQMTDAEASRRASARERNRAEFPQIAWICDEVRKVFPNAQFLHGEEDGREIGKFPSLPPNCVEVDAVKAVEMAAMGYETKRRRK